MKPNLLLTALLLFNITFLAPSSSLESSSSHSHATDHSPESLMERAEFLFKELDVHLSVNQIETLLAHKEREVAALADRYVDQLQTESRQVVAALPLLHEEARRRLVLLEKTTAEKIEEAERVYDRARAELVKPEAHKKGSVEKMRTLKQDFELTIKNILEDQKRQVGLSFKETLKSSEEYIKKYQASPAIIKQDLRLQLKELMKDCTLA